MSGRGKSRGDETLRAALFSRLLSAPTAEDGLLPSLAVLRAWFDAAAIDGDTADEDAEAATYDAGDEDDEDAGAAEIAELQSLPDRVLLQPGVQALMLRVVAHVEVELAVSPPLLEYVQGILRDVVSDAVSEIGPEGVSFRRWLDNGFGCVHEALYKCMSP